MPCRSPLSRAFVRCEEGGARNAAHSTERNFEHWILSHVIRVSPNLQSHLGTALAHYGIVRGALVHGALTVRGSARRTPMARRRRTVHTARHAEMQALRASFIAAASMWHGTQRIALLDIGANAGTFVETMMKDLGGAAAQVHPSLWEPQPSFQQPLEAIAARWKGDVVTAAAWTESSAAKALYLHSDGAHLNPESASLVAIPRDFDAAHPKSATARYNVSESAPFLVRTIDFADFLVRNLSQASGPRGHTEPAVPVAPVPAFLKLDIEGGEYRLLPSLLASRALCGRIGFLFIEWHLNKLRKERRKAGLALKASTEPALNASCRKAGFEPPRVMHDLVPENNLQVCVFARARVSSCRFMILVSFASLLSAQVDLGGGCRPYCYNNRYCTREDCAACARCHVVSSLEVQRTVARLMRGPSLRSSRSKRKRASRGRAPTTVAAIGA